MFKLENQTFHTYNDCFRLYIDHRMNMKHFYSNKKYYSCVLKDFSLVRVELKKNFYLRYDDHRVHYLDHNVVVDNDYPNNRPQFLKIDFLKLNIISIEKQKDKKDLTSMIPILFPRMIETTFTTVITISSICLIITIC